MSEPRGFEGFEDTQHDEEMTQQEVDAAMNSEEYMHWRLASILGTDHPVMVFMANEHGEKLLAGLAVHVRRADFIAQQAVKHNDLGLKFDIDAWASDNPMTLLRQYGESVRAEAQRESESPV